MGRLLFFMFASFVMILIIMAVSKLMDKVGKPSKKGSRAEFEKDLNELAEKIKNK